jgi:putative transposase
MKGLVDLYFVVFLHLETRRCWISMCTTSPDSAWVSRQAKNFMMDAEDLELAPKYVMRDNDTKFTEQFDEVFKSSGVEIKRNTPIGMPPLVVPVVMRVLALVRTCAAGVRA